MKASLLGILAVAAFAVLGGATTASAANAQLTGIVVTALPDGHAWWVCDGLPMPADSWANVFILQGHVSLDDIASGNYTPVGGFQNGADPIEDWTTDLVNYPITLQPGDNEFTLVLGALPTEDRLLVELFFDTTDTGDAPLLAEFEYFGSAGTGNVYGDDEVLSMDANQMVTWTPTNIATLADTSTVELTYLKVFAKDLTADNIRLGGPFDKFFPAHNGPDTVMHITIDYTQAPVPEPATIGLLSGAVGTILLRRRRP